MSRIELTSNADFYVSTLGSDTTGDGSVTNPWASPAGAFNALYAGYDLTGHIVTVRVADGVYTQSNQFEGLLLGQKNAGSLRFVGNYSNPYACVMRPDPIARGYAFSVNGGAAATIGGFYMDMLGSDGMAIGQDTTAVGVGSVMVWDDKLIFGPNINPWNHCSVNGTLYIEAGPVGSPKGYTIAPGLQYRTWSSSGPTTWLTVSDLTKIRKYQGVNGPYQHPLAQVVSIDVPNSRVQISHATSNTFPVSNMGVNFSNGGQCHILTGVAGRCQWVTNGEIGRATLTVNHGAFFYYAYLGAYQLSIINYTGAAITGWASGKKFDVRSNAVIDCESAILPAGSQALKDYLPGSAPGTFATGGIYV